MFVHSPHALGGGTSTTGELPLRNQRAVTWPDFSVSLMSLWLIFSPIILEFRHDETAWFNAVLAGLLLLLTVIARAPGALRAVGIASVGLWMAVSPWTLRIESIEATLSGALTGLCVLGLAIRELRQLANCSLHSREPVPE